MDEPVAEVLNAVREVVGDGPGDLQKPRIDYWDLEYRLRQSEKLLDEGVLREFEAALKNFTGAAHAIALSSGTAALHAALMAAGVRPGDEVLCPSLTFAATANAICHAGAVPHFVDVNHATFGIHPHKLRIHLESGFERTDNGLMNLATHRIVRAMVPVHLLGIPCEIDVLCSIANRYGITIIEDAAEALGSEFSGFYCGTIGKAGILSFNLNKIVTTGGGGAVLTDDENLASTVRHLASQAKVEHPFLWQHDQVGYNYRMSPLCAALGVSQMSRIEQTLEKKAQMYCRYAIAFEKAAKHTQFVLSIGGNAWLNVILVDPRAKGTRLRDDTIRALIDNGFEARALFTPMHMLDHFKHYPRQLNLATSEDLFRRAVCLPSSI